MLQEEFVSRWSLLSCDPNYVQWRPTSDGAKRRPVARQPPGAACEPPQSETTVAAAANSSEPAVVEL